MNDPEGSKAPARDGDTSAGGQASPSFEALYRALKQIAVRAMAEEKPTVTLQPTALVHEAYLKMAQQHRASWKSDSHFLSVGALAMRRILVDQARRRNAEKHGGGRAKIPLEGGLLSSDNDADVVAVDDAIRDLARLDERHAKIVEMRFFGGMTEPEMAEALEVSERTVRRDWRLCRAWLRKRLSAEG